MHLEIEHLQENAVKIEITVKGPGNKIIDKYVIEQEQLERTTYVPFTRDNKLRKVTAQT